MPRALCFLLCLSSLTSTQSLFAQNSNANKPSSSAVQVVYAVNGSTLTTFNVDPETLQATQVGSITLHASISPGLVASANGRFLYYIATSTDQRLYVYDTNSSGAPSSQPAQTVIANQLGALIVHPSGQFLYSVAIGPLYKGPTANYAIVRNLIDQTNGKISQPVTEVSYNLRDYDTAGFCTPSILGFNPAGDTMYDQIFCVYPFNDSAIYSQRSVNLQTGALGPAQPMFSWNDDGGIDFVQFQNSRLFDFSESTEYEQNTVTVYQAQAPLSAPLVSCGASMLAACSDFEYGLAHPSGQYAFLIDPNGLTDVGQIDTTTQQMVQTSTIPYSVQGFSPDGTIAYGVVGSDIDITGFNIQTGQTTAGGAISLTAGPDAWLAAQRY